MSLVNGQQINRLKWVLSDSEVRTLFSSPIQILPNPPSGKAVDIISCTAQLKFGGTSFDANTMFLTYVGAPVNNNQWEFIKFLTNSTDIFLKGTICTLNSGGSNLYDNLGMIVTSDGDATTGNSSVILDLIYRLIDVV